MIFQRETFEDFYRDSHELRKMHCSMSGILPEKATDNLDLEAYFALQYLGRLLCFTARDAGILCGYATFIVQPHLHHKNLLWATCDLIFIHPQKRVVGLASTGQGLIDYCERQIKDLGADVIAYSVLDALDWSNTLTHDGYKSLETSWYKWVGE